MTHHGFIFLSERQIPTSSNWSSTILSLLLRYLPKSKKAAALLLYNLWSDKDVQSFLKRVSWSFALSAKICNVLGVCSLFPTLSSKRPHLSQVFVRNWRRKLRRLGGALREVPSESEWDTNVTRPRNLEAPVSGHWLDSVSTRRPAH